MEKIFFQQKKFNFNDFPIISIYNFNKIFVDNCQKKLYQPISKLNDIKRYIYFANDIKVEIISDSKNTSNRFKSHDIT